MNWEQILDKYGLAVAFLAIVLAGVYLGVRYVVLPGFNRLLAMIDTQLTESRAVRAKDTEEFMAALARRDKLAEEQTRAFADALRRVDEHRGRK